MDHSSFLFTGGSGLLGTELKQLFPEAQFPESTVFDVTDYQRLDDYIQKLSVRQIIHAAAFTSPPKVDQNPEKALDVNIFGTANVVKLCMRNNLRLIYISTDYVFDGQQGNYAETDAVNPVNKYAWSKLGGECAARLYENSLIVRTTFGPNIFPYDKAFHDQYTSRESVKTIASYLAKVIEDFSILGVLHIGGNRKTVFEYAKQISPEKAIEAISIHDMNFKIPQDTSLNVEKFQKIS